MLTIRLSRHGRNKRPFYRIVLTEHSKPVKAGFKDVLGWFDPLKHDMQIDMEKVHHRIAQGAKPSERTAKLLYNHSKDENLKKFVVLRERVRKTKKEEESA